MLLASEGSERGIAFLVGVSGPTVHRWRTGERVPGPAERVALEAKLRIPASTWDAAPTSGSPPPSSAPAPPPSTPSTSAESMIEQAREQLRRVLEDANRVGPGGPNAEMRAKLSAHAVRIMELIAKMEQAAEDLEGRAVRRSRFLATVVDAIVEALKGHPEASKSVEDALERLDVHARTIETEDDTA